MQQLNQGVYQPFFTLCLILASLVIGKYSHAEHSTIKVVTEYLTPYQIESDDGSLGGFSTDIIQAMFNYTKDTPAIEVLPWARALETAKKEPNVLIYSIARTPARETLFQWVGSIKTEEHYFWGLKKHFVAPINNYKRLKPYKVAASRHSNVAEFLETHQFPNIHHLIQEDQNMLMLFRGRVDLIVATELTVKARIQKLGLNFNKLIKLKEVTELNNALSIAFNKDSSPALVSKYQQAYLALETSGALDTIRRKWQGQSQLSQ